MRTDHFPELASPLVNVPVRRSHDYGVRSDLEPAQHDLARLPHGSPRLSNFPLDLADFRLDEESVMDWGTHLDPALGRQAARYPQHLGAVRLQREVPEGPGI